MICIGCSRIGVFKDHVETAFPDKTSSCFYPPVDSLEFVECAKKFAYVYPMQYGLEHDLAHTWLAVQTGKLFSDVVWADAHQVKDKDQKVYDDEEHLVNRMLFYINTGKLDEDFGVLNRTFGAMLPTMAARLWRLLRSNMLDEVKKNG